MSFIQAFPSGKTSGGGSDNVIEGYFNASDNLFYEESTYVTPIVGSENVIYISLDTNLLYRYDNTNSIFIRVDEQSDGQSIQVSTMPTASASELGNIYQFVGTTTLDYTNGYFYKCVENDNVYSWERINTQDSYTKSEIGNLNSLPDNTKNVVENINDLDINKEDIFRYAHGVDIPIASVSNVGTIIQYIGTTTSDYISGFFYQCQLDSDTSTYKWVNIEVQPASGTSAVESVNGKTGVVVLDAKDIGLQVETMPTANVDNLGRIVQFIGTTGGDYTNGRFYKCVYDGVSTYSWEVAEDYISKSNTVGLVKNDGTIDENTYATTTQLADKADKVTSAVVDDFATLDSNGNLTDSGINKNIVPSSATLSNKLATINDVPDDINDLDDVVITSPTNAQILAYNSTSGKWENQTGQAAIGGAVFKGSINFANLPTTGMVNGDWYDIKDAFTTDNRFEEGSGIACAAGTDVIWVDTDSKWNILTPSGVNSFNGRVGAVSPASGDYDASDIDYDNTTSGLTADDVQEAINEIDGTIDGILDGTNIDSFGDVENALSDKADKSSAYLTTDTTETTLDDADYVPFYDTSATAKRKTLWSNIKAKLKTYFDTLYASLSSVTAIEGKIPSGASSSNKMATASDVAGCVDWSSYAKTGVHSIKLPMSITTETVGTGQITVNADDTITVSGTFASETNRNIYNDVSISGEYIYSGCPSGGSYSTYFCAVVVDGQWVSSNYDYGSGTPTLNISSTLKVQINIKAGTTFDSPITFKPMVRLASDTNTEFTFPVMTNEQLTEAVATIPTVSVSHTGTASSTGVRKEVISVNNVEYEVDGSAYMEQSVTLSTSQATTVTFTNAIIADGKMITMASSLWDLVPDDIVTTTGVCTITLPKWSSAETIGVRLYVR